MKIKSLIITNNNQQGGILVMVLMIMSILIIMGFSLVMLLTTNYQKINKHKNKLKAHYIASSGIDKAIIDNLIIDTNKDWSDNKFLEIYNNEPLGEGYFSVSSEDGNANSIIISSIGQYNNHSEYIHVLLNINWLIEPHHIQIVQWSEQRNNTLELPD